MFLVNWILVFGAAKLEYFIKLGQSSSQLVLCLRVLDFGKELLGTGKSCALSVSRTFLDKCFSTNQEEYNFMSLRYLCLYFYKVNRIEKANNVGNMVTAVTY